MKSLEKWEKIGIAVIAVCIMVTIGVFTGKYISSKKVVEVNTSAFEDLIEDKNYKVSNLEDDGNVITMNIETDGMTDKELEALSNKIYSLCKSNKWVQEKVLVNVFKEKPTDFTFYTDGVLATIEVDNEKQSAFIGKFAKTPSIEPATVENIATVSNELVTNEDNKNIIISLDMNLEDTSEANVMAQSIAYTGIVKNLNEGIESKGIESIGLKINPNKDTSFVTNSEYENIIKTVNKIKLSDATK